MLCIYMMKLIFPVSFIFINLHDIFQEYLKTQQVYDPCSLRGVRSTAKCPSFSVTRSHLEKRAYIMMS